MANFGIKVSSGKDVLTAQEADIVFASNRNMLKTHRVGFNVAAQVFSHGLKYAPIFFTSVQASGTQGSIIGDNLTTTVDSNNFSVSANTKYYLFYEQAN